MIDLEILIEEIKLVNGNVLIKDDVLIRLIDIYNDLL